MMKKLITPQTIKIFTQKPPTPTFFKKIDWSGVKKSEPEKLSKPVQTILKEIEYSSSSDAPGPRSMLKNN